MTVYMRMPEKKFPFTLVLVIFTIAVFLTAALMAAFVGKVYPERYIYFPPTTMKPLTNAEISAKIEVEVDAYIRKKLIQEVKKLPEECKPEDIRVVPIKKSKRNRRHLSYVDLNRYSYVVSINQHLYGDVDVIAFNCAGVVISENLVLAGRRCVHFNPHAATENFSNAQIRSQSNYFSMNGITHEVTKVFQSPLKYPYSELMILQSKSFFSNKVVPVYLPFKNKNYHNGSLRHLVSFGFGDTWRTEPIISRFEKINVENWSSDQNVCKNSASCDIARKFLSQNDCCVRGTLDSCNWLTESLSLHGRFLVNEENYIMAVELDREKKRGNLMFNGTAIFLTFRHQPFLKWIYETMYDHEFKGSVRERKAPIILFSKIPKSSFMTLLGK